MYTAYTYMICDAGVALKEGLAGGDPVSPGISSCITCEVEEFMIIAIDIM
jgi:hypothetical protein